LETLGTLKREHIEVTRGKEKQEVLLCEQKIISGLNKEWQKEKVN